ncbi:MAG: T9SS type A sorting domain-containing protein [Bacteroidales bacterium]
MKKSILILTAFISLLNIVNAQWQQVQGLYGGRIDYFAKNNTTIFAGIWGSGVFLSATGGSSWVEANNGLSNYYLYSVAANDQIVFAGTNMGIYRSTNNGSTWQNVSNVSINTTTIMSVFIYDSTHIFIGPESKGLYLSTDNGITWTQQNSGIPTQCTITSIVKCNTYLIASGQNGYIYKSADNGISWTSASQGNQFNLISAGNTVYGYDYNGVFLSTDYGTTWSSISSGLSSQDIRCLYVEGNNIYASILGGVYLSSDNGLNWTLLGTNNAPCIGNSYSIITFNSNLLVGTYCGVLLSTNNGVDWVSVDQGFSNLYVSTIASSGASIFVGTDSKGIFESSDNGQTWVPRNTGLNDLGITSIVFKGSRMFAGTFGGEVYMSTNFGSSWVSTSNGLPQYEYSIYSLAASSTKLFAAMYLDGLYVSGNNGASWTQKLLATCDAVVVYGNNVYVGTEGNGVLYSPDNGVTWSSLGLTNAWVSDIVVSNNNIYAGSDGGIYRSSDNGATWEQLTNGLGGSTELTTIAAVGPNVFTGGGYSTGIFFSPDNGQNWSAQNIGLTSINIIQMRIIGTDVYASTYNSNKLYKRPLTDFNIQCNTISGIVYYDSNNNNVYDSGETGLPQIILSTQPSNMYSVTDSLGYYSIYSYMVTDTLKAAPPISYSTVYPQNYIISQSDTGKNFGIHFIQGVQDLRIVLTDLTPARPGFDAILRVTYMNSGTIPMDGQIKLAFANEMNFISCSPPQITLNGDTLIWDFTNLAMLESRDINIVFNIPSSVPVGSSLPSTAYVYPIAGDTVPGNNIYEINQIITSSYDPNVKEVDPSDGITIPQILNRDSLIYTIRFQNTGTDTAFNIKILDTLDINVDPLSFKVLSASHPYTFTMRSHGIVEFLFMDILLPDSSTNETLSHGFVKYAVCPKTDLHIRDKIYNTAYIYFDYNPAVTTNTTITTVLIPMLTYQTSIDGGFLNIYPNPATNELTIELTNLNTKLKFEIINLNGQTLYSSSIEKKGVIDISHLPNGFYLVKLSTDKTNIVKKFIKE